ncbi:MAG: AAA family ATPase, partial [Acidobacteria bacterium]|nr:AAA family ATPase [Acidobacteriota bacterium]
MPSLTLRIEHGCARAQRRFLRLQLRNDSVNVFDLETVFRYSISPGDREKLRWYWEEYLDNPTGASEQSAHQVRQRLISLGEELFEAALGGDRAQRLWTQIAASLEEIRIEIVSPPVDEQPPLPWELLRDPATGRWLATECRSFVRGAVIPLEEPLFSPDDSQHLRVLGLLAPPGDLGEVQFRSVFRNLLQRRKDTRIRYDVLRPPTLGRLTSVLLEAESLGEPYHVVHLDGMGVYSDLTEDERLTPALQRAARSRGEDVRPGNRGYLVLDHAQDSSRMRLVDAASLADAMGEARVPVIVLNACVTPAGEDRAERRNAFKTGAAFQAVAQDLTEFGLSAAVQAPYSLEPDALARWFESFYSSLADGVSAGEAARAARKLSETESKRSIAFDPVERVDWCVPVVHESIPAPVLSHAAVREPDGGLHEQPKANSLGVIRDDIVVNLDRLFQGAACVLLHGPAGSGKSHTADEFAEWLRRTQGLEGPVLHSTLAHRRSLGALLDHLAAFFQGALKKTGLEWERMEIEERFDTAIYIMNQIPILWVWDSVESIRSQPSAITGGWDEEQQELVREFLESCTETQARILLISRDQEDWLAKSVRRAPMKALAEREAILLTRKLLEDLGASTTDMARFMPLVNYAEGNPLALRLMTCQSQAEKAVTASQMSAMTEKLSVLGGEPVAAALSYVLKTGFTPQDHDVIALLKLFKMGVDLDRITAMVAPHRSWALGELASQLQRTKAIGVDSPLERAKRLGLLTPEDSKFYRIEPSLHERLSELFHARYPGSTQIAAPPQETKASRRSVLSGAFQTARSRRSSGVSAEAAKEQEISALGEQDADKAEKATRAFVQSYSDWGRRVAQEMRSGASDVLIRVERNEANLLHACSLARAREWWDVTVGPLQLLGLLYEQTGRATIWQELVEDLAIDCVDPRTRGPLKGRDEFWRAVIEQRIRLAMRQGSYTWALELQKVAAGWDQEQVEGALSLPFEELDIRQRSGLLNLAESLNRLGTIARSDAAPLHSVEQEAIELCEKLGEDIRAADWAYDLALNYTEAPGIRDLSRAEKWLRRGLEYLPDQHPAKAR